MPTLQEHISARTGARDPARVSTMIVPWVLCAVFALALYYLAPLAVNLYWIEVLRKTGIAVIAAVSLNIVNGFAGQFSMGHAGFMALGAYVGAAVTYYGSLLAHGSVGDPAFVAGGTGLMLVGIGAGALVAALAGYVVGLPSLRLRGDYLAIVTLGFGEIIRVLLERTPPQISDAAEVRAAPLKALVSLNGSLGFRGVPDYASNFWIWLFAAVTGVIAFRIKRSGTGRALLSIREDEIAARAMGVNLTRYKIRAFVIAAALGGVAGALSGHIGANPTPDAAGFQRSFDIIIYVVLGGLGSISGSALAAIVLALFSEILRGPDSVLAGWPWWLVAGAVFAAAAFALRALHNAGWRVLLALAIMPPALIAFAALAARLKAPPLEIDLATYRMPLYALMLILVMILRPNGLFGVRELWELFGRDDSRSQRKGDGIVDAANIVAPNASTTGPLSPPQGGMP
ncbi:hypothetical protein BH11PLA1_BH11PLA1_12600 [soil metagenome]